MQPETGKYLSDIHQSAQRIRAYVEGKTKQAYLSDVKLQDAIQWNFIVIGEALSQLSKQDSTTAQQISEWHRIIAFRNQLIHGYGVINNEITWDIIENKLTALQRDVVELLSHEGSD